MPDTQGNVFLTYENLAFSMPLILTVTVYVSCVFPSRPIIFLCREQVMKIEGLLFEFEHSAWSFSVATNSFTPIE